MANDSNYSDSGNRRGRPDNGPNNRGGSGSFGGRGGPTNRSGPGGFGGRSGPNNRGGPSNRGGPGGGFGGPNRGGPGGFGGPNRGGPGGFGGPNRGGPGGRSGPNNRGGRGGPSNRSGYDGKDGNLPNMKKRSAKVIVEPHRHEGIYIARGKEDLLVTKSLAPGESVYNEKRIVVENDNEKIEYRVWNPFRSKLAAAVLGGIENIHIKPGSKVLYLGASSGTTVSHVSDIVGPNGIVYAVEFSTRMGRDLITMAKKRTNVIPIVEDARHPYKYRMLVGMVDTVFADVAQPDQARIIALNAQYFLKQNGAVVISIKANCIDSTLEPSVVFAKEVKKLQESEIKPKEQLTLEPYERDHALVVGIFRSTNK